MSETDENHRTWGDLAPKLIPAAEAVEAYVVAQSEVLAARDRFRAALVHARGAYCALPDNEREAFVAHWRAHGLPDDTIADFSDFSDLATDEQEPRPFRFDRPVERGGAGFDRGRLSAEPSEEKP